MGGQGLAVNLYSNPNDGNGGCWEFSPKEDYDGGSSTKPVTFDYLEEGKTYMLTNAVEGFENITLSDDNSGNSLKANNNAFADRKSVV